MAKLFAVSGTSCEAADFTFIRKGGRRQSRKSGGKCRALRTGESAISGGGGLIVLIVPLPLLAF